MELEKQVCSLELANKLKKLGIRQGSLFYWAQWKVTRQWHIVLHDHIGLDDDPELASPAFNKGKYAAFTVAELGELIGTQARSYRTDNPEEPAWQCGGIWIKYVGKSPTYPSHSEDANTEADARAKMLVYLLENRLIPGASLDGKREAIPRSMRRRGVRAARLAPNA